MITHCSPICFYRFRPEKNQGKDSSVAADEPSLSTQLIQGGILMSYEDRPLQIERVNDRHYVIAKAICRAIRCRITGGTEPTPDNTVDMVVSRELRREVVENVSRIAAPGQ